MVKTGKGFLGYSYPDFATKYTLTTGTVKIKTGTEK
jgi:hypothetical protein